MPVFTLGNVRNRPGWFLLFASAWRHPHRWVFFWKIHTNQLQAVPQKKAYPLTHSGESSCWLGLVFGLIQLLELYISHQGAWGLYIAVSGFLLKTQGQTCCPLPTFDPESDGQVAIDFSSRRVNRLGLHSMLLLDPHLLAGKICAGCLRVSRTRTGAEEKLEPLQLGQLGKSVTSFCFLANSRTFKRRSFSHVYAELLFSVVAPQRCERLWQYISSDSLPVPSISFVFSVVKGHTNTRERPLCWQLNMY